MNLPVRPLGRFTWKDIYRLPLALAIYPFVIRDYRLRKRGLRPDQWHWGDLILLKMRYVIQKECPA